MATMYLRQPSPREELKEAIICSIAESFDPLNRVINECVSSRLKTDNWFNAYNQAKAAGKSDADATVFANTGTMPGSK